MKSSETFVHIRLILFLRKYIQQLATRQLLSEMSTGSPRAFFPPSFRTEIFESVYGLSHPWIRVTQRLLTEIYLDKHES